MTDEECEAMLTKLRKKKPTLWIAIISSGRNDVIARRLLMSLEDVKILKAKTDPLEYNTFCELRKYASKRRHQINTQIRNQP